MEIEELLYEETKTLSTGVARFLLKYCLHELKDIENDLKRHHVSMKLNECIGDIVLRGTITGIDKCNKALTKLLNPIKIYIEELPNVDKRKIFISEEGRKYLDRIENDEKVVIDMSWEDIFRTGDWRDIGVTYDKRNFQTMEGLTVSWKYGDIAREKADVLVNSANPDLMYFTECGKALAEIGGKSFIQQCRSIDNIRSGDIASTTAGNLACKHVIHAVCCNWVKGSDNSQKTLRTLLSKILCECQQLNARSLAMPCIGTGKHKFPEEVVHEIFQEEIIAFSSKNPFSSLRDIRIVIFDADKVSKMDVTSKLRKDSEIKFENVNMYLLDKDIAQEPVDAIINVPPPTLKLLGTGMMCGTILAVGGPIVQRQLDDYGEVPPGSILATSGGSMRNTQLVLHAVPSRYDEAYPSNLIERCFHIAKSRSLGTIAISVTDIETFSSSAQQLAECVLSAAENASYTEGTLNVVVHVRKQATSYKEIKTWWKGIVAGKGLRVKKKTKTWNKTASQSQSSLVSDTLTGATSVQETRRAKLHIVARTDLCIQNSLKLIDTLIS